MQKLVLTKVYRVRVLHRYRVIDVFNARVEVVNGEPDYTRIKGYVLKKYNPERMTAFIDDVNNVIDIIIL